MTARLPLLSDEEIQRTTPPAAEAGFGTLTTSHGSLPLTAMAVHACLDDLLADVTLTQTFVNTHPEPLEATYIFPLPDRAAVTGFRMEVAGRVVEGVLQERGTARRTYDRAIEAGHRAAITEEERPGVFTLRVGNLMPGESATVRLTLTGPLPYSDGEATFRFPLVVAPRYIPGTPLPGRSVGTGMVPDTCPVPDASRITPPVLLPGFPKPLRLSLMVDVAPSALPLTDFRSSLHAVLDVVSDSGARRILIQPGERADRDFILRFRLADSTVRTALTFTPDREEAREGTFALTVVPPVAGDGPQLAPRPRDVIFVLDRSGSMEGWKIVAARRALGLMVDCLTERDRFAVYAFDYTVEKPAGFPDLGLQPASDRNRFQAVEFLAGVAARGGTEMVQPLALAVKQLAGITRPSERILVLVTDGQVGNEDQILRLLEPDLQGVRVFTLGIDKAVNAGFLRRLADLGSGAAELVESEERLDEVLGKIHRHIGTPVLTGLRLEPLGFEVEADSVVPRRLPDLFAGAPLSILGRYRGTPRGSVRLSAAVPEGGAWSRTVEGRGAGNPAAAAHWARGHIRELEDRFVIGAGDRAALEKRILTTSLQFNVLCRFTAFVAVDQGEVINPGGVLHRVTQPVETPAGWQAKVVSAPLQEYQRAVEQNVTRGSDMVTMGKLPQTPRLKVAIDAAIEEARNLNHDGVDTEHLLLGLLSEQQGLAAQTLMKLGLKLEEARDVVRIEYGRQGKPAGLGWPKTIVGYERFTEQARRVMQLANQEAQRFNHEYIGTEHLLLGLINEGSGGAAILENWKALAARRRVRELLESLQSADPDSPAGRLSALNLLAGKLETLIKDLQASGMAQELRPLEELLANLRVLAGATPGAEEVDRLWSRARSVLRKFVGDPEQGEHDPVAATRSQGAERVGPARRRGSIPWALFLLAFQTGLRYPGTVQRAGEATMIDPVKECDVCGDVCSNMDTVCPRCQRYGSLRRRFQCTRCRRLLDTQTSCVCEAAEQITAATPGPARSSLLEAPPALTRSDLVDRQAPHPALAAAVGGAVFGMAAGAGAGYFFLGENPLILGLIGLVSGTLVGALMGGGASRGRR